MAGRTLHHRNLFTTGHALVIGTGTNVSGQLSQKFQSTINDAEWLAHVLAKPSLCAYPEENVKILVGKDATRECIIKELDIIIRRISALDGEERTGTVVVFFSGHGLKDRGKTYLIPYGFSDDDNLATDAIDGDLLYEKLRAMEADRVLLLLNCCYAGGVMEELVAMPFSPRQMRTLLDGQGFAYLSSSQSTQQTETGYLPSLTSKRYSPFTLGLARGLSGRDKQERDGFVKFSDLVSACVAFVTSKTKQRQLPHFDFKGDNFVVGHYHPGAAKNFSLLGDEVEVDIDIGNEEDEDEPVQYWRGPVIKVKNVTYTNSKGPIFTGVGMIGNGANFASTYK